MSQAGLLGRCSGPGARKCAYQTGPGPAGPGPRLALLVSCSPYRRAPRAHSRVPVKGSCAEGNRKIKTQIRPIWAFIFRLPSAQCSFTGAPHKSSPETSQTKAGPDPGPSQGLKICVCVRPARTPGTGRKWGPRAPQISSDCPGQSFDFEIGVGDRLGTLKVSKSKR